MLGSKPTDIDVADAAASKPLAGLRVLDLTVALSGPYGTLILAALGAEVIKVEMPGGSDIARFNPPFCTPEGNMHLGALEEGDYSLSMMARNRAKKSVELDLKDPRGREVFRRMAAEADIVFENLSDGVVERLGVDYESLRDVNPRLIYCSLSGLGNPSRFPGVKAMDITVQAVSGAMDTTGDAGGPPMRFGLPISDLLAPLYAVIGVQAALRAREQTGRGQRVDVSMLDCLASLLPFEHLDVMQQFGFPPRSGNQHARLAPFGVFRTSDGYVSIAAASESWMQGVFDALGRPELIEDPRFSSRGPRVANSTELNRLIEAWTSVRSTDEVIHELAERRGVPCVPVRSAAEVLSDKALIEAGVLAKLEHPFGGTVDAVGGGIPIRLSGSDTRLVGRARPLGADTDGVLREMAGLSDDEIAELRSEGVI
ncbi:CaiB/BaiF CoA transferase family protein [Rhodococcus wratislaviensis]|uniref:CaiB/BaiF CoA transferase family protein n=1 Tax=Rhodococcus wratislaviensis TaxID=44752 RepID=UPI003663E8EB